MNFLLAVSLLGLLIVDGCACLRAARLGQAQHLAHTLAHVAVVVLLALSGQLVTLTGVLAVLACMLATTLALGASHADQRRATRTGIAVRELAENAGTVLAAIRAASDVLMNENLGASSRKGIVRRIRALSTRLSDALLDEMDRELGTARVETGPVSLFDVCADTLSRYASVARSGRIDLSCVVEEDLPRLVETDSRALRTGLSQLLERALESGAPTIEIVLGRRENQLGCGVTVPESVEFRATGSDLRGLDARVESLGGEVVAFASEGRRGVELRVPLFPVPESEAMLVRGRFRAAELAQTPEANQADGVLLRRRVLVFAPRSAVGMQLEELLAEAGAEVDKVGAMAGVKELAATDPRGHEAVVLGGIASAEEVESIVHGLQRIGVRAPILAVGKADDLVATGVDGVVAEAELDRRLVPDLLQRFCAALAPGLHGESLRVAPIESRHVEDPRFRPLVERFVEAVPGFLREIRECRESGDHERLGRLAHRIKGIGSQYGYDVATEAGARLERVVSVESPDERVEAASGQLYTVLQGILLGAARLGQGHPT